MSGVLPDAIAIHTTHLTFQQKEID